MGLFLAAVTGLYLAPSRRVACQDHRTRSAPAGVVLLPTVGCAEIVAPGSRERSARGEQEAQGLETALWDSVDRPDPAAVLLGILQTAHRFRTKRQLWTYSGLGIEMHSSADHHVVKGQLERKKKHVEIRGLNEKS